MGQRAGHGDIPVPYGVSYLPLKNGGDQQPWRSLVVLEYLVVAVVK
jgi:hypothetical protein